MTHHRHLQNQIRAQVFSSTMESLLASWQTQTGKSSLRIGDAERDVAAQQLGEHFASGRLERWEYDERLDAALAARTRGELARVFRDLPATAAPMTPLKPPPRRSGGFRFPLFPLLLILIGVAIVADAWWVFLVGLGVVILLRRSGGRSACGGRGRQARG
jgi:hypothetical protein